MNDFEHGHISIPKQWELRIQHTYIEPAETMKVPLAMQNTQAKPRANIVVSRIPTTVESPDEAMNEFYAQTAQAVPGLRKVSQDAFSFEDGASGASLTVSFHATPQVRLVQKHVFRVDKGVLTQLVATVDEPRIGELDASMAKILRSFKP